LLPVPPKPAARKLVRFIHYAASVSGCKTKGKFNRV
jgi:hypothetical protein